MKEKAQALLILAVMALPVFASSVVAGEKAAAGPRGKELFQVSAR